VEQNSLNDVHWFCFQLTLHSVTSQQFTAHGTLYSTPNVATDGAQKRQTGFTILPLYLSAISGQSSITDSSSHSGTVFEATFAHFRVTKFRQNFLKRHFKRKGIILKILAGALRMCVIPLLLVNPALCYTAYSIYTRIQININGVLCVLTAVERRTRCHS